MASLFGFLCLLALSTFPATTAFESPGGEYLSFGNHSDHGGIHKLSARDRDFIDFETVCSLASLLPCPLSFNHMLLTLSLSFSVQEGDNV